jgi:hypothetical protein
VNFMEVMFALLVSSIVGVFACLSMTTAIQMSVKTNDILSVDQQLENAESYVLAGMKEPAYARGRVVQQVEPTSYAGVSVVKLEVLTPNAADVIYIPTHESLSPAN